MLKVLILLTQLVVLATTAMGHAQTIRFAPLPMQDRETVIKQFRPMTTYLEKCMGITIVYNYSDDYGDLEENYYRYIGKHDAVALSVIQGQYDAGGLKSAIAKEYTHMGLQILAETPPFSAFALAGNTRTLKPELMERIRRQLIDLDPDGKDKELLSFWGKNIRYGAVSESDGDYQTVRDLLGDTKIPKEGNF